MNRLLLQSVLFFMLCPYSLAGGEKSMKKTGSINLLHNPIITGLLAAILSSIAFSALAAALAKNGVLSQTVIQPAGSVCAALGTLLGSMITAKKAQSRKLICAMLVCAGFVAILFLCNLLFLKDSELNMLPVLLPSAGASLVGGVLAVSTKTTKRRHRK